MKQTHVVSAIVLTIVVAALLVIAVAIGNRSSKPKHHSAAATCWAHPGSWLPDGHVVYSAAGRRHGDGTTRGVCNPK